MFVVSQLSLPLGPFLLLFAGRWARHSKLGLDIGLGPRFVNGDLLLRYIRGFDRVGQGFGVF